MTAPKPEAPTLDEQIEQVKNAWHLADMHCEPDAILASLQRLRAIDNAKGMPSVADKIRVVNISENGKKTEVILHVLASEYDSLRLFTLNQVASLSVRTTALKKAAERAQHLQDRLNRMEALLREPSEEMQTAGVDATEFTFSCKRQIRDAFRAMSAALLAKVEADDAR